MSKLLRIAEKLKIVSSVVLCVLSFNYQVVGQGKLVPRNVSEVKSPYGYYEYLPNDYTKKAQHPLLIALHGIGEAGNGSSELSRVLKYGPAKLIEEGKWPASRPFIVVAPQSFGGFFNPTKLHDLIEHLKDTYRVDENRIYLTGLSAGGISIWNYLAEYQDQVAAVVPIAGKGQIVREKNLCKLNKIPAWAFHGANDGTVNPNGSIIPIEFLQQCSESSSSKVTIYPGVGHDSWTRTYDLSGKSSSTDSRYDSYDVSIYDWLLSHTKGEKSEPKKEKEKKDKDKKDDSKDDDDKDSDDDNDDGDNDTSDESPKPSSSPPVTGGKASSDCGCDYTITSQTKSVDGKKLGVGPGDVVCLKAGFYQYLQLENFVGSSANPVTIKNCGGKVTVGDGKWHYGIVITGSKHFKFTGTGDRNHQYGILIGGTRANSGLGIYDLSTDFEIDHIEVKNVPGAGMHILTRPTCDPRTWRENFTMRNVSIHDNYLHDIDGEGMYIGHSGYPGKTINCDGKSKKVYPHSIQNIKVYNNITQNTGWDGFQVSCADKDCFIYNNTVTNFGIRKHPNQQAGIVLGGGTTGKLYNNFIKQGTGGGIHIFGIGNITAFNNVIVDVGEDGVFIGDKSTRPGYSYEIVNNTIVNPKNEGLRINTDDSKDNKFYNNLIVNPGAYATYSNKDRAFIHILKSAKNYTLKGNHFERSISDVNFVDPDKNNYQLKANSSAINKGVSVSGLGIDKGFTGKPRAVGAPDAGAYEYQGTEQSPKPDPKPTPAPTPSSGNNLRYEYYEGSWSSLPDFSQMSPKKSGTVSHFSLSPRSRNDYFGFAFSGYITINQSGTYTFYTTSDDGSKLYIDDKTVVNNDGLHSAVERSGSVYLSAGKHAIKAAFFERTGGEVLEVRYAGPGISRRIIPSDVLSVSDDSQQAPPPPSGVVSANVGPDQSVSSASSVSLYGNGQGPNPFRQYQWTKVSGPSVSMKGENTANLTLSQLKNGTYVFRFTVFDSEGNQGSDEMKLQVGDTNARTAFGTKGSNPEELISTDRDYQLMAYPNPVQSALNVTIEGASGEALTLRMVDAIGRTVLEKILSVGSSQERIQLDVSQYINVPGLFYLITENSSGERNTLRLIKR